MESLNGAVEPAVPSCSLEKQGCFSPLQEKISKLLSLWTALQMAVQNEWGGCDSLEKSEQLASDVFSWLFQSKELLQVEDLENLLHERLLLSFNTEIEDGSIEEVAEQLMIIREDHLHGNLVPVHENHQKVGKRGQQTPKLAAATRQRSPDHCEYALGKLRSMCSTSQTIHER